MAHQARISTIASASKLWMAPLFGTISSIRLGVEGNRRRQIDDDACSSISSSPAAE
jgi:hypothetical protein